MNIIEKGKTKTDLILMREAADYYAASLKLPKKIDLTIAFTDQHMGRKFLGKCYNAGDKHVIYIRKSMETSQKLKIMAHELTHVKQHVRKEYVIKFNSETKGFDVFRFGELFGKFTDISYKNRPWEKEAKKNEEKLYTKFLKVKNEKP